MTMVIAIPGEENCHNDDGGDDDDDDDDDDGYDDDDDDDDDDGYDDDDDDDDDNDDDRSVHQRQRPKFPGLREEGVSPIHWSSKKTTYHQ